MPRLLLSCLVLAMLVSGCGAPPAPGSGTRSKKSEKKSEKKLDKRDVYVPVVSAEQLRQPLAPPSDPKAAPAMTLPDSMAFELPAGLQGDREPPSVEKYLADDRPGPAANVSSLMQAVDRSPDDPLANYRVAAALKQQGEEARSLPYLNRALALAPNYVDARMDRGWVLAGRKEYATAEADFQEVLKITTTKAPVYCALGTLAMRQMQFPLAIEYAEKSIAEDAAFGPAYIVRGLCRARAGDIAGAIADQDAARERSVLAQDLELLAAVIKAARQQGSAP